MYKQRNANTTYGLIHAVSESRSNRLLRRSWLYWPIAAFVLISAITQTM